MHRCMWGASEARDKDRDWPCPEVQEAVCSPIRAGVVGMDHLWEDLGSLRSKAALGSCLRPYA